MHKTTITPSLPLNRFWVLKKKSLLLFAGEAQLLVQPNVIKLAELLQQSPNLSKLYRVSLCCKVLWGDWGLPSFAPVGYGKQRKHTLKEKVSRKGYVLSAPEKHGFDTSGVATLLLCFWTPRQHFPWDVLAHSVSLAFAQPGRYLLPSYPARTTVSNITSSSLDCLGWAPFLQRWRHSRQAQTMQQLRQKVRIRAQYHRYTVLWDKDIPISSVLQGRMEARIQSFLNHLSKALLFFSSGPIG